MVLDGHSWEAAPRLLNFGQELSETDRNVVTSRVQSAPTPLVVREVKLGLRQQKSTTANFAPPHWFVVAELQWADSEQSPEANEIWVPIPARKAVEVDVQSELIPPLQGVRLSGAYEDAFGDLQYYTKGLESLETNAVVNYLRERYRNDDKKIQVLGIEVPQSAISQWGLLILIACQVYLYLHLAQSKTLWKETVPSFPWIALYPGFAARVISTLSISVLPASAALLLTFQGWEGTTNNVLKGLILFATIVSVLIVGLTIRNWPAVRLQSLGLKG